MPFENLERALTYLDQFLNITFPTNSFTAEYTIKFFPKSSSEKQNSILVNRETKQILDMKLQDPQTFDKICECFKKTIDEVVEENEDNDKKQSNVKLEDFIHVNDFFEKIVTDDDIVIGFINQVKWDNEVRLPGSLVLNFSIQ